MKVKDISKIGGMRGKGKETWLMKLGNEEQKREIMVRKKMLKGRKERIMDLTWKERKMKWKLVEIAREEERFGKSYINYGKIRINEEW